MIFLWSVLIVTVLMVIWKIVIPWWQLRKTLKSVRKIFKKYLKENPDNIDMKEGIRLIDEYLKEGKLFKSEK